MNEMPVLFENKESCCGCSACFAICPNKAIKMIVDEEGFEYPEIDMQKCISCSLCQLVCPFK